MIVDKFIEKATAAGAEVVPFADPADAARYVKSFLEENRISRVLVSAEVHAWAALAQGLTGASEKLPGGELWVGAGVAAADCGIAETGTLVHFDRSDEVKNIWTLPDVCFVLLERDKIVANQEAIAEKMSAHLAQTVAPSPQVSFVTGPSRTADIENRLTIGVHGPARLIILLI